MLNIYRLSIFKETDVGNLRYTARTTDAPRICRAFRQANGRSFPACGASLGRDGAGLFDVLFEEKLVSGPDSGRLTIVKENGPYDGIYYAMGTHHLATRATGYPKGEKYGPGMLLYIPYDLVSGRCDRARSK